jgi:hypothetical protein
MDALAIKYKVSVPKNRWYNRSEIEESNQTIQKVSEKCQDSDKIRNTLINNYQVLFLIENPEPGAQFRFIRNGELSGIKTVVNANAGRIQYYNLKGRLTKISRCYPIFMKLNKTENELIKLHVNMI